jgi:hypothetical protein
MVLKNIIIQIYTQPVGYHGALCFQYKKDGPLAIGKSFKIPLAFADNDIRAVKCRKKLRTALIQNGSGCPAAGSDNICVVIKAGIISVL